MEPLDAEPPASATGAPKFAPSILNWTDPPLGLPAPAPVPTTVAVKLTLSPKVDGNKVEEREVSVSRLLTVWPQSSVSLLSLKFVSAEVKNASTVWLPAVSVLMEPLDAEPPASATGAPKFAPSILNWTEPPLGLPAPAPVPTRVAVKLTLSPNVDGFKLEETAVNVSRLLTVSVCVALVLEV